MSLTVSHTVFAAAASVTPSPTVTSFVSIRNQPSTDGVLLAALRPGNSVPLLGALGDWYVVNSESQTGYIHRGWVDVVTGDPPTKLSGAALEAVITAVKIIPVDSVKSFVRVREKPDFNSKMVAALYQGQAAELVSESDDWFVVNAKGKQGYISRSWGKKISPDIALPEQHASTDDFYTEAEIVEPPPEPGDLPIAESIPLADESDSVAAVPVQEPELPIYKTRESSTVAAPITTDAEPPIVESQPITSTAEDFVAAQNVTTRIIPSDKVTTFVLIRAEPDINSPILSRLPPGNSVELINESEDWYQVLRNGQTGYVSRYWAQKLGQVADVPIRSLPDTNPGEVAAFAISESTPQVTQITPATDSVSESIIDVPDDKAEPSTSYATTRSNRSLQPAEEWVVYPLESIREPGDRARMTTATALLENDQAHEAYRMLSRLEPAWAGHAGFDYLLGVAALSSGKAAEAVFSLDRVVYSLPGFVGARLELARALYEVGDYGRARKEFQALLDAQPPAPVREIILSYLDALKTASRVDRKRLDHLFVNHAAMPRRTK